MIHLAHVNNNNISVVIVPPFESKHIVTKSQGFVSAEPEGRSDAKVRQSPVHLVVRADGRPLRGDVHVLVPFCHWQPCCVRVREPCVFSVAPLKRGPDRVSRNFDEINWVVRITGQRILRLTPRHEPIYHTYFFAHVSNSDAG
ncbi:unnamed protein product [Chrysodeixis includens]|uniref:Uncharacterized protein n=1 Tax=Chrysodeixis includens TaxID=689277 RepID=A0A9N8PXD6_CHRIL|nr:unnamed protein product [Chrysodeixis includens]